MGKAFIIVFIFVIILAYLWYTQYGNENESFSNTEKRLQQQQQQQQNLAESNRPICSPIPNLNQGVAENNQPVNVPGLEENQELEQEAEQEAEQEEESLFECTTQSEPCDEYKSTTDPTLQRKFRTRNHATDCNYKYGSYLFGKRSGYSDGALNYIDESNDLLQPGYTTNDQFVGQDETDGQYAPYKPERKCVNKYKTSEIFNSQNYLPSEKSINPEWFDIVPEPISVKNRHLINVSKPIGINTIGSSLRNPSYDIRGSPPCPKFVISPWMQSTIEPDTNLKSLCT